MRINMDWVFNEGFLKDIHALPDTKKWKKRHRYLNAVGNKLGYIISEIGKTQHNGPMPIVC